MNDKPGIPICFLFVLLLSYLNSKGQIKETNVPKAEIGVSFSSFIYQGDLTPEDFGSSKTIRYGVFLHYSKILNSAFMLRTNLAFGSLRGDDSKYDDPEYRQQRNFKFKTGLLEISEWLVWNPLKSNYDDKGFYPYIYAGLGLSIVNIDRDWSNYNAEYFNTTDVTARLAEDSAHSLPTLIPFLPFGIGLRYNINWRWGVNAEATYRVIFTDYLDGFSVAANPDKNDKYHTIALGVVYRVGKKNLLDCPKVQY